MPPLDDLTWWARGEGLEIVLLVLGAVLAGRALHWVGGVLWARFGVSASSSAPLTVAEEAKHRAAITQAVERTVVAVLWFVVAVMVLIRLGIPITTLVAPATVAGVALGFGAQRIVGDLLSGFFIISENQYGLGDTVRISQPATTTGVEGIVEAVSLRTTRLRTATGELVTVPNGEVRQVTNKSRDWAVVLVDVPVRADADIDLATSALRDALDAMAEEEEWVHLLLDRPAVAGVESIEIGVVHIRLSARTAPDSTVELARALRRRAATALAEVGLALPLTATTTQVVNAERRTPRPRKKSA